MIELEFRSKPASPPIVAYIREEIAPGVSAFTSGHGATTIDAIGRLLLMRPYIHRDTYRRIDRQRRIAEQARHRHRVQAAVAARKVVA